jgi:hypothetical protein
MKEFDMPLQSSLALYDFDRYILEIVTATFAQGGSASRLDGHELLPAMDAWEFPRYPARTVILPPEADLVEGLKAFISANETFLREPGCWLGTWIHPQTGCVYLDITTSCTDLHEARRRALEASSRDGRWIVALYNSRRRETVYLSDADEM